MTLKGGDDIRRFELLRYLKRWMPLIICFFLAMSALSYRVIAGKQTYTAATVIEYANSAASEGLAPDHSEIDVNEIGSSANMAKVVERLGAGGYSLDSLCAAVTVEAVFDEQYHSIQEALNDEGEEFTQKPTAYVVRFTLNSHGSEDLARDILNELMDVYFSDYSTKHVNQGQVYNETSDLIQTDYDYLEMVERLERQLSDTMQTLSSRYQENWDFRSVSTGYSFSDLHNQFALIKDVDVPRLYAMILGGRVTKDRDLLLDKYQNRIAGYNLTSRDAQENIAGILEVIDAYVEKLRRSGNTDIDYNYILNDVYDRNWAESDAPRTNRTVQYDALLRSWVNNSNTWDNAELDAAYCAYVIRVYQGGSDDGAPSSREDADGSGLPASVPYAASPASPRQVEAEIAGVIQRMNALYEAVSATNAEYNEYLGAKNIRILSGVSARPSINMTVYMAVIALFFIVVGCCGAVLLGRLGDLLEYLFLTDSSTGCRNRVSCDRYIQNHERLILPLGACCINLQVTNQQELNELYGREETDHVLREFGRVLRELFESRGFVGYNGGGQFWVFFDTGGPDRLEQELERLKATLEQALGQVAAAYQMGAANAENLAVFRIRGLISSAVKARRPYTTGGDAPKGALTGNGNHPQGE